MAKLVVITKGLTVLPHELNEKWITVGRTDENTFQVDEETVSSRHCEVRLVGEELEVRDMQSTNGTFANGHKITEGKLKPGQVLRLGMAELRFEASAPAPIPKVAPITAKFAVPEQVKTASVKESKPLVAPTEPDKKFQVLFVDDSLAFLETFTDLCSVLSGQTWEIHTAPTADRALTILAKIPVDLAVLDIGMPMLDGLQLMGIIRRRYPAIKIAVMTGNASESKRADSLASGAELFIEKPVSPDGTKVVFNMLNDLVSWTHREGFTGALRQVGLQEVIQMECVARHSTILEIRNQHLRGQIFIEAGAITHATVGSLVGEKAFNELLSMTGGEFQLKPFIAPPQRTVNGSWEFLLLEAARRNDEDTAMLSKKFVEAAAAAAAANPPSVNAAKTLPTDAPPNPA